MKLGNIKVTGNLTTRNYVADLDMGPITFAPNGLQPAHLFPAGKSYLRDFSGTVRLAGPITWSKGKAKCGGEAGPGRTDRPGRDRCCSRISMA